MAIARAQTAPLWTTCADWWWWRRTPWPRRTDTWLPLCRHSHCHLKVGEFGPHSLLAQVPPVVASEHHDSRVPQVVLVHPLHNAAELLVHEQLQRGCLCGWLQQHGTSLIGKMTVRILPQVWDKVPEGSSQASLLRLHQCCLLSAQHDRTAPPSLLRLLHRHGGYTNAIFRPPLLLSSRDHHLPPHMAQSDCEM